MCAYKIYYKPSLALFIDYIFNQLINITHLKLLFSVSVGDARPQGKLSNNSGDEGDESLQFDGIVRADLEEVFALGYIPIDRFVEKMEVFSTLI